MPRTTNTRAGEKNIDEALKDNTEKQRRIVKEHIKNLREENSELAKEVKTLKEQLSLETQIKNVRKSSLDESSEALKKQQDTIESIRGQRDALLFQMEEELKIGKITFEEYKKGMELVYELDDLEKSHLETRNELLGTYGKEQRAQAVIILNESKKNKELEDSKKFIEDHIKALEKENETLDKNSAKYKENVDAINAAKGQLNNSNRPSIYDFAGKDYFSTATKAVFGGGFLGATGAFIDLLMPNEDKAKENKEKNDKQILNFAKELKKIGKNVEDIEDTEKDEAKQTKEKGGSFGDFLGKFSGFFKKSGVDADDVDDIAGAGAAGAAGKLGGLKAGAAGLAADVLLDKLDSISNAVYQMTSALNTYVDEGASFIAANKGAINAALYGMNGTADKFTKYFNRANDVAGTTLFKLDDYLSQIRTLTSSGIGRGVEVAALLSTVAEKTVPKFDAQNASLRRLVLLGEKAATQRFFGLESIIQGSLNKQFGESSYLNQLFDSVNANLQDALVNITDKLNKNNDDNYKFLYTAQTWLGSLYEQGVDSQTITRISNVLNAIGSGNITAMSSDAGMQKLALLAMDAAGLDYASIMQEGLTVNNTNQLMNSMVTYLQKISDKTNENNVLESAYANLFGLSMTDMYAFRNLNLSKIQADENFNLSTIDNEIDTRLSNLENKAYTSISEKIDNLISNIQFDFGTKVANQTSNYIAFKGGQVAYKIGEAIEQMPVVGAAGKLIKGAGAVSMFGGTIVPMIGVVKDLVSTVKSSISGENTVKTLYDNVRYKDEPNTGSTSSTSTSTSTSSKKFKTFYLNEEKNEEYKKFKQDSKVKDEMVDEEFDKEDPILEILKELEKTFMQNTSNKEHLAIAVSLQGMSNEVLRSFASIFADEESMTDVFKSKKAKNKLFDYDVDKEPSDPKKTKGNSKVTTGNMASKINNNMNNNLPTKQTK